jgi:protein-tyrosine phosphatase
MVNNVSCIYKQIFISNQQNSCDINLLKQNDIKAILHLGNVKKSDEILLKYKKNNIVHKFIKMHDMYNTNINHCCNISYDYINQFTKSGDNILIHCKLGISRSPTIVAYYLMHTMHEYMKKNNEVYPVLDEIMDLMRINRPCIKPNKSFINQLKIVEKNAINTYNSSCWIDSYRRIITH